MVYRFNEKSNRNKAVEDFQQVMFTARSFVVEAQKNVTEALEAAETATPEKPVAPPKFTGDELTLIEEIMKENEVWMDERMQKQVQIESDSSKDPEITVKDLNEKGKRLQMAVSADVSR